MQATNGKVHAKKLQRISLAELQLEASRECDSKPIVTEEYLGHKIVRIFVGSQHYRKTLHDDTQRIYYGYTFAKAPHGVWDPTLEGCRELIDIYEATKFVRDTWKDGFWQLVREFSEVQK